MCVIYDYIGFILLKKLLQRNLSLDLKNTICHGKGEGDMRIEKNMFVYVKAASRFEHGVYFFSRSKSFLLLLNGENQQSMYRNQEGKERLIFLGNAIIILYIFLYFQIALYILFYCVSKIFPIYI